MLQYNMSALHLTVSILYLITFYYMSSFDGKENLSVQRVKQYTIFSRFLPSKILISQCLFFFFKRAAFFTTFVVTPLKMLVALYQVKKKSLTEKRKENKTTPFQAALQLCFDNCHKTYTFSVHNVKLRKVVLMLSL